MSGWIKIHRNIVEWEWWSDTKTAHLFIHLLLTANYHESKWRGHKLIAGQLITGRDKLARDTGLSQRSVRTSLIKLKTTNEVTIKTTNKYSVITIVNWELYQSDDQQTVTQATNKRPTNDHIQEGKEYKNSIYMHDKKIIDEKKKRATRLPDDWDLPQEWGEWCERFNLSAEEINREGDKFRDYWIGTGKTKVNWQATWRNWIRTYTERKVNGIQQNRTGYRV